MDFGGGGVKFFYIVMNKQVITLNDVATPPSPFNHVVAAGGFLFLSSQLSVNLKTNQLQIGDIKQQTDLALKNIQQLLNRSGASMENIVRVVIYMRDVKRDFEAMNSVYKKYFLRGHEPARTTVQAPSPLDGIDIEIEVTAFVG